MSSLVRNWESSNPPRSLAPTATTLPPASGMSWTNAELAELQRLTALCRDRDDWKLEFDQTEAGDPWAVIYDRARRRTVLHLARIDRRYVAVFPTQGCSHRTVSLQSAIEIALSNIGRTPT